MTKTNNTTRKPWLATVAAANHQQRAVVIGAGMAGAATARALAERGWRVTVLDRTPQPAMAASGNPQGMLYIRLSPNLTPLTQLVLEGYRHTLDLLQQAPEDIYQICGLIQLPDSDKERIRQQKLIANGNYQELFHFKTAAELSDLAGLPIDQDGLYFPNGGWLQPPLFVRWLLDHPGITFQGNSEVTTLTQIDEHWQLTLNDGRLLSSEVVVIACGHHANRLAQTAHLPLKGIRGQTTSVPATTTSTALARVVCEDGYIAPAHNGRHTLGATFHFDDPDDSVRMSDHQLNLENIAGFAPQIAEALNFGNLTEEQLTGKTGYRCTTPDYLPMVGPVMDVQEFQQRFAVLAKNAKTEVNDAIPWLQGLYINTGHGSRGLITAPLSGELLAGEICGEELSLTSGSASEITEHLHPGRFPARTLIRGTNQVSH